MEIIGLVLLCLMLLLQFRGSPRVVYMGKTQQFGPQEDVTTVHPVSIHAATCDHDWETLTEKVLEMAHEKKVVVILNCRRCGLLDKTVQITSPAPPPAPPPPCEHDWQAISDQVLEMAHEKRSSLVLTCRKCGQIDKTSSVTSKPPEAPFSKGECRHKWEKEKTVTLDSAYEQMLKSIRQPSSGYGQKGKVDPEKKILLDLNKAPAWMFAKKYISIKVCSACGEVDKTIAANFDITDEEEPDPENSMDVESCH